MTPKETVLTAQPKAILDYYELLRKLEKPCWFIRLGLQGPPLSAIARSPREAWKDSADSLDNAIRSGTAAPVFARRLRRISEDSCRT